MFAEVTLHHSAMSESGKDALLLAQAQELERIGLRLQTLEAASYNITPFAQFNAGKRKLTICIPVEFYSWYNIYVPFETYIIKDESLFCDHWTETHKTTDNSFTCDIDVDRHRKKWCLRGVYFFSDPRNEDIVRKDFKLVIIKQCIPGLLEIQLKQGKGLYITSPHKHTIWTIDVEERFCAELDKAWRAFGAEV